ncbi:hypothetical protein OC834_006840 [Tilletia horrida]|nr:hypothetical protein OC834_006840 [Tilletia horrida]
MCYRIIETDVCPACQRAIGDVTMSTTFCKNRKYECKNITIERRYPYMYRACIDCDPKRRRELP